MVYVQMLTKCVRLRTFNNHGNASQTFRSSGDNKIFYLFFHNSGSGILSILSLK